MKNDCVIAREPSVGLLESRSVGGPSSMAAEDVGEDFMSNDVVDTLDTFGIDHGMSGYSLLELMFL